MKDNRISNACKDIDLAKWFDTTAVLANWRATLTIALAVMVNMPTFVIAQPPTLNKSWTQHDFVESLKHVEKPNELSVLKVGYFGRRGQHELGVEDAFKLLEEAVQKSPTGSTRWFALQNARAMGIFQAGRGQYSEGLKVYGDIFARGLLVHEVKPADYVLLSVGEFLECTRVRFRQLGMDQDHAVRACLRQAIQAYIHCGTVSNVQGNKTAPILQAIRATGSAEDIGPLIESALDQAKEQASVSLILAGADLMAPTNATKALYYLQLAKKKVLAKEESKWTKQERMEALTVYKRLVALLLAQKSGQEALEVKRECVEKCGVGQAELLLLLKQLKVSDGYAELLAWLSSSESPWEEVRRATLDLLKLALVPGTSDLNAAVDAENLLQSYLKRNEMMLIQRIEASYILGNYYARIGKKDHALAVTDIKVSEASLDNRELREWRKVVNLRKRLGY